MSRDKIEIKKSLIPYNFDILLADEMFNIKVSYNNTADLFVLALTKDGKLICAGEPVIYGVPLFEDVFQPYQYPHLVIVPLDESGEKNAVTYDNFNETVFLIIEDGGD